MSVITTKNKTAFISAFSADKKEGIYSRLSKLALQARSSRTIHETSVHTQSIEQEVTKMKNNAICEYMLVGGQL